jgi:hypothetical protein
MVEGTETLSCESRDGSRMSEAGVAGDGRWLFACILGDLLGCIAGDGFADEGFGGGPINDSAKGSGEMESVEEPAWLGIRMAVGEVGDSRDCECASNSSLTSLGGITDDSVGFLRVAGFAIGDCATFLFDCFLVLRAAFVCLG